MLSNCALTNFVLWAFVYFTYWRLKLNAFILCHKQQQQQPPSSAPQPGGPAGPAAVENDASKLSRPVMPPVTQIQRFPNSPAVPTRPPVHQQPPPSQQQQSMVPQHLQAPPQPGVAMNSYAPQQPPSTSNLDTLFTFT